MQNRGSISLMQNWLVPKYIWESLTGIRGFFSMCFLSEFQFNVDAFQLRKNINSAFPNSGFLLFIAAMSNSLEIVCNRVMTDWPDKCHVWGFSTINNAAFFKEKYINQLMWLLVIIFGNNKSHHMCITNPNYQWWVR